MTQGVQEAVQALDGIVERMGLDAHADSSEGDDGFVLELGGPDSGRLADGPVLDALQHLANRIAHKAVNYEDEGLPVAVDAGGWRARRTEELKDLAADLADEARETGRAVTAEPLSAYERRLVHLALQDEQGISTRSVGEGRDRRLRVYPD